MVHLKFRSIIWSSLPPILLIVGYLTYIFNDTVKGWEINKDSIINAVFVKRGWFWNSLVLWYVIIYTNITTVQVEKEGTNEIKDTKQIVRSLNIKKFGRRYLLVTLWWILFTQGIDFLNIPPIMDLCFIFTGGYCNFEIFDNMQSVNVKFQDSDYRKLKSLEKIYRILKNYKDTYVDSSYLKQIQCAIDDKNLECQDFIPLLDTNEFIKGTVLKIDPMVQFMSSRCRSMGGHWIDGHDPSGHIFLLTLMIMMIIGELPKIKNIRRLNKNFDYGDNSLITKKIVNTVGKLFGNGSIWNLLNNGNLTTEQKLYQFFIIPPLRNIKLLFELLGHILNFICFYDPTILLILFLIMWCYSFLITTIVFHTFYEQVSGFLSAYIVNIMVYRVIK